MINWVDLLIIALAVFSLQVGFHKGCIKQVAAFFGIFLGIFVAGKFYMRLASTKYLIELADNFGEKTPLVAAYFGLFACTVLFVQLFAYALRRGVQGGIFGHLDTLLGGIVSVAKVYVIVAVVAWSVFRFLPDYAIRKHLSDSWCAPKAAHTFDSMLSRVPHEYIDKMDTFFSRQSPDQDGVNRKVCTLESLSVWRKGQ